MTNLTFEERYKNASKALRKAGVKTYRNVQGCCRSCIGSDKFDNPTEPILWHYGGQGNRIEFSGNYVVWAKEGGYVNTFYLNHSNITPDLADKVVEIFTENGIAIEWDKSDSSCVGIKPMDSIPNRSPEAQAHIVEDNLKAYNLSYEDMFKWRDNLNMLERIWDLAFSEVEIAGYFKRKREAIDEQARQFAEREAREKEYLAQKALAERVSALVPVERKARFESWFDLAKPMLTEADVTDKGARLLGVEADSFVGEFSDREAFARSYYLEDIARLPKWVLDNLSMNNVAHDLGRNLFYILNTGWSTPSLVWKR